jgi:hypothetical protein
MPDARSLAVATVVAAAGGAARSIAFGQNLDTAAGQNALAKGSDTDLLLIPNPDVRMDWASRTAGISSTSEPDLVRALEASYRRALTDVHDKALAEFESRKRRGTLPRPIDRGHVMAQFTKDKYASHR